MGFPGLRSTPRRRINRAATAVDSAITRSFRSSANASKPVGQVVTKGAAKSQPACLGLTLYPVPRVGTESAGAQAVWKTLK